MNVLLNEGEKAEGMVSKAVKVVGSRNNRLGIKTIPL